MFLHLIEIMALSITILLLAFYVLAFLPARPSGQPCWMRRPQRRRRW